MKKLNNALFFLLVLFLPTQLGKHFFFPFSYIFGVRVDYLSPTVYLTDVIILFLTLVNLKTVLIFFRDKKVLIGLGLLLIDTIFSKLPVISVYWLVKIAELLVVFSLTRKIFAISKEKLILTAFLISSIFELLLSVGQFIRRSSIQGIFYYFGERLITLSTPGIAKASIHGIEFLRPYGTFSHPNSLAGYFLILYFFVLTNKRFNRYLISKYLFLLISSLLIFISFSKIAIAVYLVLNTVYYILTIKNIKNACKPCIIIRIFIITVLSLIFFQVTSDPQTVVKRIELIKNSLAIISKFPVQGVGLGAYLIEQANFTSKYYLFFNQPVHNIFLLYFSELGLAIGAAIIYLSAAKIKRLMKLGPYVLLAIAITGLFDHYWLTLQQNFILGGLIMGAILSRT